MQKIDRDIYEYGEIERDAARLADFAPQGGWFSRFYKWIEGIAREEREELIQQRNEDRRAALSSSPFAARENVDIGDKSP